VLRRYDTGLRAKFRRRELRRFGEDHKYTLTTTLKYLADYTNSFISSSKISLFALFGKVVFGSPFGEHIMGSPLLLNESEIGQGLRHSSSFSQDISHLDDGNK